jgi:hypothetical protein
MRHSESLRLRTLEVTAPAPRSMVAWSARIPVVELLRAGACGRLRAIRKKPCGARMWRTLREP